VTATRDRARRLGQTEAVRFLVVVRHAKAAAPTRGQRDFDRPLTKKGRRQSERLREWAMSAEALGRYGPTTALVSAAARTRETYAVAFAGTPLVHALETSELIYNGARDVSATDLVSELAAVDPVTESLLLVAHNPSVLELAVMVASAPVAVLDGGRFPLGAALVFALRDEPVGLGPYEFVEAFVPED
jgi:phosphohistidine phosphatase SixA